MIDIAIVIHKNYTLLTEQLLHWPKIAKPGSYRLLFGDNTPPQFRQALPPYMDGHPVYYHPVGGSDGETHGSTLDYLIQQSTSDIVCVVDSDFFWLCPTILEHVESLFALGCKVVGTEQLNGVDFRRNAVPNLPGLFLDRNICLSSTFVCTSRESHHPYETGWRIREKVLAERLSHYAWPTIRYPGNNQMILDESPGIDEPTNYGISIADFFGDLDKPMGVHLRAGSWGRILSTGALKHLISFGLGRWATHRRS